MVMSMTLTLRAASSKRFSIPDRSGHLFGDARRYARRCPCRFTPIDAGRHPNQLGEPRTEGAERRAADHETDFGDAEVAPPQQRHRPLDAPGHQIGVRRLAVGELELAAESAADICTPRASASTSKGWAYSRSIRSLTRRSHARSLKCCALAGPLVTSAIVNDNRVALDRPLVMPAPLDDESLVWRRG